MNKKGEKGEILHFYLFLWSLLWPDSLFKSKLLCHFLYPILVAQRALAMDGMITPDACILKPQKGMTGKGNNVASPLSLNGSVTSVFLLSDSSQRYPAQGQHQQGSGLRHGGNLQDVGYAVKMQAGQ